MPEDIHHIILNGEIHLNSEPLFLHNNRSFCYGDGLFESMHACSTEVQFFDDHFCRLYKGMNTLKMNITEQLQKDKILREIKRILNRDKVFGGARIRLAVFRCSNGLYTPASNEVSYLIDYKKLDTEHYYLNTKGLATDVFPEIKKPVNILGEFKTANSLVYIMAGVYAKENGLDDSLLMNERGHIVESYHSNLFCVKNDVVLTPSLQSGCVHGIIRAHLIQLALHNGYKVLETDINEKTLLDADEIFLTNAVDGIRWVLAFRQRRYYNKVASHLLQLLNKKAFEK